MEILRDVSVDWLGKKWYFFAGSWVLLALGIIGYFVRGGFAFGIDFTGGTIVYLKFASKPDLDKIRESMKPGTVGAPTIQTYDDPSKNTVLVRMQTVVAAGRSIDQGQKQVLTVLRRAFDPQNESRADADFNNVGLDALTRQLIEADPDNWRAQNKTIQETETHYRGTAQALLDYRNRTREGLVPSLDDLRNAAGVTPATVEAMKKRLYAGPFAVKGVESVGAIVGSDLRRRAGLAIGLSFLGMLVYIGFRFKPIYGLAAIFALFHDVAITLGLFALTQKEISLTVIAALLTLVGYSVNDTIVIFDRVRENLRLVRKEQLPKILNLSINQTLSRTIITSGFTFVAVVSLLLFGGEVLNGFAFALTIGILIGTYSTIGIAAPIVEWWYRSVGDKSRRKAA